MHRLAATPGGWNPELDGVIFVEQTPGAIVLLTAADTDIQAIANASELLPTGFPSVRVVNLLQLQQQITIDTYAETVLAQAQVIVLRLLGGQSYWEYGLEVVEDTVRQTGGHLIVIPGDDRPDPTLVSHSTLPLAIVNSIWRYFAEGGVSNLQNALLALANAGLGTDYPVAAPEMVPKVGVYRQSDGDRDRVGVLFYRSHYLSGNTAPIESLCDAIEAQGLAAIAVFVSSLHDQDVQAALIAYFQEPIQVLLNTTSFAISSPTALDLHLWQVLDVPVLQVIFSSGTAEQWEAGLSGLSPRDTAMNVALPEVDGRIISRAVSFKAVQTRHEALQTDVVSYEPQRDRIQFVVALAANWVTLRQTPVSDRRVALILSNYPTRDGRLANGVGLDTPTSCVEILKSLQNQGYPVSAIPTTSDQLIQQLTQGITNDPEARELRQVRQTLSLEEYLQYFETLPEAVQAGILARWPLPDQEFEIAGIQFGNIFVGIQPARGYDLDPTLNYHAPDLEPTHAYLAFYYWLRSRFQTQAIVHVGKHGNLEWLPGKSLALSETCYPEVAFGALPHLYPFIVNDPGEGSQAKRRSQAVIIDHLTPPMTRAELYGGLQKLEGLIDEYYEAQTLDPSRLSVIRDRIEALIQSENLAQELGTTELTEFDRYLCELKEAQIRDGLHIFGQCPTGRQLRDLTVAIARHPQPGRIGLTQAIAQDWQLAFDPLATDPATPLSGQWRTVGAAIEALEVAAADFVDRLLAQQSIPAMPATQPVLDWIERQLLPNLKDTSQEMAYLLHGLQGGYVPAAPSGAPTRGRPEVLPTGRNFFSVDIRAIPTESAWDVGRKAAEALIERYTQDHGDYPQTLGLSMWGTATMRTGGDDLAEALALLGVRPVWEGVSRRVINFEILPLSALGRPRVDVTLRISGFFRDAFPNLIDLFDQAVIAVSQLDEPPEQNSLAAKVQQETAYWQQQGLTLEQSQRRSHYRIFGSKPGAYGAGLQGLIEAQNWTEDADLARAYINWSSYAYAGAGVGHSAPEAFEQRLKTMQVVLHNQDNREHDLLDSDDYYQFQGGLTVAIRATQGKNPTTYFGDHALPQNPKVRSLSQEIARVYRSRVVNPKWIAGVMRHGYKGAFELSATVDYLFAYDATARCVEDYMYQGIAEAYVFNPEVQAFVEQKNPWALRDMAERLLEANQRGLWRSVDEKMLDQLRAIALQAEAIVEGATC